MRNSHIGWEIFGMNVCTSKGSGHQRLARQSHKADQNEGLKLRFSKFQLNLLLMLELGK
jgi:hypothetical protein